MLTHYQKQFFQAITSKDLNTIYYFPRQMGKTYVRDLIKQLGRTAQPAPKKPNKEGKNV